MMTTALLITSTLLAAPAPAAVADPSATAADRESGRVIPDGHFRVHSFDSGRTAHLALVEFQIDVPAGMTLVIEDFAGTTIQRPVPEDGDRPFVRKHFALMIDRFGVFRSEVGSGRMPGESCNLATKTDGSSGVKSIRDVPPGLTMEQTFEAFLKPGDYPIGPPLDAFRIREETCTIRVLPNGQVPPAPRPIPRRPGAGILGLVNPAANP